MVPHELADMAPGAGAAMTEVPPCPVGPTRLWPTNSASQIAKRLHRLRSAIRSKAERLRQEGLLPHNPPQHFDVNPPKRRPPK